MKSIAETQAQLFAAARPTKNWQWVALEQALGCVLAEDIIAAQDVPPADNSAMDGYALCWLDWQEAQAQDPQAAFVVSQRIVAGRAAEPLAQGTAARIFTGGEIPQGADTVVMQENTRAQEGRVVILNRPAVGDNIRKRGQDICAGSLLLAKGARLGAIELGLVASQGITRLPVSSPLNIALVNTGNELVEPGEPLDAGQIYNTNGIAVRSLLQQLGCRITTYTLADDFANSCDLLAKLAREHQVIITTGGVSAGEEDHIKAAVASLGTIELWRVAMKPGKPLMIGRIEDTAVLGLPGNPVSALITFLFFAKPFIERLQGSQAGLPMPYALPLLCADPLQGGNRAEFLRVQRTAQGLVPFNNQSSGVLRSLAWADGVALVPAQRRILPGEPVDYWSLQDLMTPR